MKNLIALSTVCLAGLLVGSCASSGVIADNDVYMQQPTATNIYEDEADPTSFANYKAEEREEIVVVTQDNFAPFNNNNNNFNSFGLFTFNNYYYYNPFGPHGNMHMVPYYQNGFYQGVVYGYNSPYYYSQFQHFNYGNPNSFGNPYMYGTPYHGYGIYGNNFASNNSFWGSTGQNHASNVFYQHRTTPTVYAKSNTNYPATVKSGALAQMGLSPFSANVNQTKSPDITIKRKLNSQMTVGSAVHTNRKPGNNYIRNNQSIATPNKIVSVGKKPNSSYSSSQSSGSNSSSQRITGTSRRAESGISSGRSTSVRTSGSSGTVRQSTFSSPNTSRGSSVSKGSSSSSSSSRSSGSSSGTSSSRRR